MCPLFSIFYYCDIPLGILAEACFGGKKTRQKTPTTTFEPSENYGDRLEIAERSQEIGIPNGATMLNTNFSYL